MVLLKSLDKEILAVTFKRTAYKQKRTAPLRIKFNSGVSYMSKTKAKQKLGKETQRIQIFFLSVKEK